MVKRTAIVLGVVSLAIMMTGSAWAFMDCCGVLLGPGPCFGGAGCDARPLFVPVDCPGPIQKTIVKKWECKIVGPCPPVSPPAACGGCGKDDRQGLLLSLVTALATPCDMCLSPGGVYGCMEMGSGGPCGSCPGGPVPRALAALMPGGGGGCGGTSMSFFGGLW
jgi:hypothetical protein